MARTKNFDPGEVLDKAMQLFWRKGYHATSMQDLVDELGINRASIYNTYGDKKQLFEAALDHYQSTNQQKAAEILDKEQSVKEGLYNLFKLSLEASANNTKGCFVVNSTTELAAADPEVMQSVCKNKTHFEELFLSFLQKGVERGEIGPEKDLKQLAAFLFALQNGIKVIAKMEPDHLKLLETVRAGLKALD